MKLDLQLKEEWKQRDVTRLELELSLIPQRLNVSSSSSFRAAMLKAAIGAGWIVAPEAKKRTVTEDGATRIEYLIDGVDVDDLPPKVCYQAGNVIGLLYDEFTSLDPN